MFSQFPFAGGYFAQGGSVNFTYTISCDPGSFALTGSVASLIADRLLVCAPGSFTLTGSDSYRAFTITCDAGSFALVGAAIEISIRTFPHLNIRYTVSQDLIGVYTPSDSIDVQQIISQTVGGTS